LAFVRKMDKHGVSEVMYATLGGARDPDRIKPMSLTDRVKIAIEVHQDGAKLDGGNEAMNALIASIPFAGGALGSILSGRAQRRMQERATDVFEAFKERLEQMDGKKIDRAFFESDEFLTLFTLTLEQIQTTHDKAKLRMLATGLANSATSDFASESRKELFLRILRDLAPEHVSMLNEMRPASLGGRKGVRQPIRFLSGDRLVVLQHLASQGLVTESLHVKDVPTFNLGRLGGQRMLERHLETPPSKRYLLSDFGFQFLKFFDSESGKGADAASR